jgi:hypothetical protein
MYRVLPKPTSIFATMVVRVVLAAGFLAGAAWTGLTTAATGTGAATGAAAALTVFVFLIVIFFIGCLDFLFNVRAVNLLNKARAAAWQ